ncbi:MAG TPA: tetratricopeptide repeat protein [Gemmatimonadales bacterium]|nr:tetratricopeptide repeat protein [Gemmatimonadales bacterium]
MSLASLVLATAVLGPGCGDSLTAADWQADLRHLVAELHRLHPALHRHLPKPQFDSAVAALDARIPALSPDQRLVELARLVASIGDGHTFLPVGQPMAAVRMRGYPVAFHHFSDGLFVEAAESAYASLVGAHVVRVGGRPVDEALAAVGALVSAENPMWVRRWAPVLLARAEVLRALGLADSAARVTLTVRRDARDTTVVLQPSATPRPTGHGGYIRGEGWVVARGDRVPLWQRNPDQPFWFQYLPASRTLYLQYNEITDGEKEPVAGFFQRVAAFAASRPVDRFVLDLRLNGGGDNTLNRAVVKTILLSPRLNRPGRFFTLIGRQTFSAAQNLVNELEKYTNTVFVGEPTGSRPNMAGDAVPVRLPRTGVTVFVSTLWWQDMDPRDRRLWTPPAVAAELSSVDFRRGRDPALDAVLRGGAGIPLPTMMREGLRGGGLQLALRRYREYRSDPVHRYVDTEPLVRDLAVSLAQEGQTAEAFALIELNAAEHPASGDAQYMLGEAYLRTGDRQRAAELLERAVALDPRHAGAIHRLHELREAGQGH